MTTFSFIDEQILQASGWAILHSSWQFTLIALVMTFLLKYHQKETSSVRYFIALGSIILSLFVFCITFLLYWYEGNDNTILFLNGVITDLSTTENVAPQWHNLYLLFATYQKPIVYTWIFGVTLFLVRLLGSLGYVEYLVRDSSFIHNENINLSFAKIAHRYEIDKIIQLKESTHINTPMILGAIKPVILFPIGMINQLDLEETEAILAHEMAHFVRQDIWINIIQTFIEALLYYHPAIWWISTNIRVERENCCDEMAVSYMGNNLLYAKTLVKIQEFSQSSPKLSLSFSQKNNFFSNRIKRILNMAQTRNFLKERVITSLVLIFLVLLFTKNLNGFHKDNASKKGDVLLNKELIINIKSDTLPETKESIKIERKTIDRDINISMENGEVTELKVDGKIIDRSDYNKYQDIIDETKPTSLSDIDSKMFFFDHDGNWSIELNDALMNKDSILKNFNFNFETKVDKFNFDQEKLHEQLAKLNEDLSNMKFDFKELDSLDFNFSMPDFADVKLYRFDDEEFQRFPFNWEFPDKFDFPEIDNNNVADVLGNGLSRDGFLRPNEKNNVELTGKYLKINGEKQPENIFRKYKRIFEEESGTTLEKNSKIHFNFEGKASKKKYRVY
ncbi:MAG: M56 family metallopeptidase [Saprospiraceae bacterium]